MSPGKNPLFLFLNVVAPSGRFLNVLAPSGGFLNVVAPSRGFLNVVAPSGGFLYVVAPSGGFLNVVAPSGGSLNVVAPSGGFLNVVASSGGFLNVVAPSGGFLNVVAPSGGFLNVVAPSGGFLNVVAPSGGFRCITHVIIKLGLSSSIKRSELTMEPQSSSVVNSTLATDLLILHNVIFTASVMMTPFLLAVNGFFISGLVLYPSEEPTHTNFLFSLCFADLFPGLISIPFSTTVHIRFPEERSLCMLWLSTVTAYMVGVFYSLLLLTIDRYIAVMTPELYRKWITLDRVHVTLVFLWIGVFILTFSPLFNGNVAQKVLLANTHCDFFFVLPLHYLLYNVYASLAMCITMSLILNVHIIIQLRRTKYAEKNERYSVWGMEHTRCIQNHSASTIMTQIMIVLYLLLWTPFASSVFYVYKNELTPFKIAVLIDATILIGFTSSLIKLPVFIYFRREYHAAFELMITTSPLEWPVRLKFLHGKWNRRQAVFVASSADIFTV
ncbi:hypothetical protein Btru_048317 [Bulinus truncatus]|nr:hypothetical protein Btru_048317 [Bulinus truncatus]